ncbi:PIG-L deacetylase family protein [Thermococcus barossii]|uniref:Diacetylchitobiose deacetylase n=1 Tax=Thermococcus barossii TaxID=54077 RepID=A0A2Z2MLF2_9EURY|nr:PIG-L deacetylase family protein [Thermococcus barossii]ASJ05575.1 diacetylchitobiose deacetylase [Thermococcus barossii]
MFRDMDDFKISFERLLKELEFDLSNPFEDVEKVLCIEPHPDDCAIGLGGTIKKLTEGGIEVVYVCMTDGSMGTLDDNLSPHELAMIRRKEEEESASLLGVKKVIWMGYRDTELPYTGEVRRELVKIIRAEKPDAVLAPDPWLPYEGHPDHRVTGFLSIDAVAFSPLPNFASTDGVAGLKPHQVDVFGFYYTARPNYFVDITDLMELKLKAVRAHRSQFTDDVWEKWEPFLRTVALYYGKKAGVKYAEGLRFMPGLFLHITPFAELI